MQLTSKIQKAINLASRLHSGQTRKGNDGLPYVSHPFSVAWILANHTDDENVIVAAMLHDVLEDVPDYRFDNLKSDFGPKVANIVKEVSEDKDPNTKIDKKATWERRKRQYIENLRNDSTEAMLVCAADKIHNLRSMRRAFGAQGDKLWDKFNSSADKKIWYYEEVARILNDKLDHPIVLALNAEISKMKALLGFK